MTYSVYQTFVVAEETLDKHQSKCYLMNDWHCTFDASMGRNLFVNVRTGHSSFENPRRLNTLVEDCAIVKEAEDYKEENKPHLNVPHPVASHLSFSCTPWLPRQDRRHQKPALDDDDDNALCSKGMSGMSIVVIGICVALCNK